MPPEMLRRIPRREVTRLSGVVLIEPIPVKKDGQPPLSLGSVSQGAGRGSGVVSITGGGLQPFSGVHPGEFGSVYIPNGSAALSPVSLQEAERVEYIVLSSGLLN